MILRVCAAVILGLSVMGCSGGSGSGSGSSGSTGSLGSFGSFGSSPFGGGSKDEEEVEVIQPVAITGVLVPRLTDASVEPALRGVLIRAEGVGDRTGYHTGVLVERKSETALDESDILVLEFRAFAPDPGQVSGQTDPLQGAFFVTNKRLGKLREVQIVSGDATRALRL